MSKRKDTIFIKEIAYALFGEETLINSSVTGTACNRQPNLMAKPALDATKMLAIADVLKYRREQKGEDVTQENLIKIIHKSIREKIQDLIRPYRNRNLTNINLADVGIFDENMQPLHAVTIPESTDSDLAELDIKYNDIV